MIFEIKPNRGVSGIEFGMSPESVRRRMEGDFESYVNGAFMEQFKDNFPTDYYRSQGVLCFYDRQGRLEGFQIYEPSRAMLGGVDLLSLPIGQAISFLRGFDPDVEIYGGDRDGAVSRKLNVAVRSFEMDEDDQDLVDSVVVARPGYYDYLDEIPLAK